MLLPACALVCLALTPALVRISTLCLFVQQPKPAVFIVSRITPSLTQCHLQRFSILNSPILECLEDAHIRNYPASSLMPNHIQIPILRLNLPQLTLVTCLCHPCRSPITAKSYFYAHLHLLSMHPCHCHITIHSTTPSNPSSFVVKISVCANQCFV